jgi:hypothetical protein
MIAFLRPEATSDNLQQVGPIKVQVCLTNQISVFFIPFICFYFIAFLF